MMPIERMRPEDFDAVFRLLSQSFPARERRDAAGQRALLSDSAYRIDILRAPSGGVQALMALWDFDDFVFFEHFAVDPACRNGGIGGQMADVHPVHHIIKHLNGLGQNQGNGHGENVAPHGALGEVIVGRGAGMIGAVKGNGLHKQIRLLSAR